MQGGFLREGAGGVFFGLQRIPLPHISFIRFSYSISSLMASMISQLEACMAASSTNCRVS